MTSKERVLATFALQEADRVPIDYSANPGIDRRLKRRCGLKHDDGEGLRRALGVDFRGVHAAYAGPKLHEDVGDRKADNWGIHRRWVEHESGGYWDYCDFPLRNADEETVANWPMPSPDDHDYSGIRESCKRYEEFAVHTGGAGLACIMNTAGFLRSMEQMFIDLATDDPAGLLLIDRMLDIQFEVARRTLEAAEGRGYCFAPTHQLQDNSPTENVIAMYETAHDYGAY